MPDVAKKASLRDFLADCKAEYKKIVWLSKKEVAKKTATVITLSLMTGVIIFGMDAVMTAGYGWVLGLVV